MPLLSDAEDAVCLVNAEFQKSTFLWKHPMQPFGDIRAGSSSQNSFQVKSLPKRSSSQRERYFTGLQPAI